MRSLNRLSVALASTALLLVAGCSKQADQAPEAAERAATTSAGPPSPESARSPAADPAEAPNIGTAVAPGVAFTYRYAFTLPAKAVSGVQQQHAAACERLGPMRCQVTGMRYDQPQPGEVDARLDLMLAPEIAHSFGRDALDAVEKADGSIANALVDGENAGGQIDDSQRRSTALKGQLARLEKRLTTPGISREEKVQLAQRAVELRGELGGEQQVRQDKEAALAMTPMSFAYTSEGRFSASKDPFGKAAASSLGSLQAFVAFLLTAVGLLLPWLLLGALVVLVLRLRAMKQRLAQATGGAAGSTPPQ